MIIQCISSKVVLKSISLVSKTFNEIVRPILWSALQVKITNIHHVKHLPIRHIDLRVDDSMNRSINYIELHLSKLVHLTHLDVSACYLEDKCLTKLCELTNLKSLNISRNRMLTSVSLCSLKNMINLRCLDISRLRLNSITADVMQGLPNLPLEELNVSWYLLDDKSMTDLCKITTLKSLNINGNSRLTSSTICSLRKLVHLQCLHMGQCEGVNSAVLLSLRNLALRELCIARCGIDDQFLAMISEIHTLKSLNICYNKGFTVSGLEHLSKLVHLTHLNVSGCALNGKWLPKLCELTNLKTLNMSHNKGCTVSGLQNISKLIHLKNLDVSDSYLYDRCLTKLCELTNLKSFNISRNDSLTSSSLCALRNLVRLHCLRMSHCEGVNSDVLHSLRNLPLRELYIAGCDIDNHCLTMVSEIRSLETLMMKPSQRHVVKIPASVKVTFDRPTV